MGGSPQRASTPVTDLVRISLQVAISSLLNSLSVLACGTIERTSESSESIVERRMGVSFRIRKAGAFHLSPERRDEGRQLRQSTPAHHPPQQRTRWIVQTPYLPTANDQTLEHSLTRQGCLNGHRPNGVRLPPFRGLVQHPAGLFNPLLAQDRQAPIQ